MKNEDIEFAKAEIRKATKQTAYGDALPLPWGLLRDAILEIERLKNCSRHSDLPESFVKTGLELAKGSVIYGIPLCEMARDELIAAVAHGWAGQKILGSVPEADTP